MAKPVCQECGSCSTGMISDRCANCGAEGLADPRRVLRPAFPTQKVNRESERHRSRAPLGRAEQRRLVYAFAEELGEAAGEDARIRLLVYLKYLPPRTDRYWNSSAA